jgi:hypothetical protein
MRRHSEEAIAHLHALQLRSALASARLWELIVFQVVFLARFRILSKPHPEVDELSNAVRVPIDHRHSGGVQKK